MCRLILFSGNLSAEDALTFKKYVQGLYTEKDDAVSGVIFLCIKCFYLIDAGGHILEEKVSNRDRGHGLDDDDGSGDDDGIMSAVDRDLCVFS